MARPQTLVDLERVAEREAAAQWGRVAQPPIVGCARLSGKVWKIVYDDQRTDPYLGKNQRGKTFREIRIEKIYWYYERLYVDAYCFARKASRTFREDGIVSIIDAAGQGFSSLGNLSSLRNLLKADAYKFCLEEPAHSRHGLHPNTWKLLRPFAVVCKSLGLRNSVLVVSCRSAFARYAEWRLDTGWYRRFHDDEQKDAALTLYDKLAIVPVEIEASKRWIASKASATQKAYFGHVMAMERLPWSD